ncbi:MAG: TrmB family transcriptional regulator [Lachnospiraceae bacterium]
MEDTQNIEKLMMFGMTRQEAVIYLCLFQNGELTGYEAAKQTGLSRSNVYSGLAALVEQGAAYVAGGSASKYTAVPIEEFCENYIGRLGQAKEFLQKNMPKPQMCGEGYITIAGPRHIRDKILHLLRGAQKRIYLSAPVQVLEAFSEELVDLLRRGIKVVLIADRLPENIPFKQGESEGAIFYRTGRENLRAGQEQIRLIIDSTYVLTGDVSGNSNDTCLYSDQKNFVNVFKEAMHNEIKLIELADRGELQ